MYLSMRQLEICHLECWTLHQSVQFERILWRLTAFRTVAVWCYLTITICLNEV